MRGFRGGGVLVLLGAVSGALVARPVAAEPVPAIEERQEGADAIEWLDVRAVSVERAAAGRRVVISLTRAPEGFERPEAGSPKRVTIDLIGPRPAAPKTVTPFPLSDDLVTEVRVGSRGEKLRAVIELAEELSGDATVRVEGNTVIAEIGDGSEAPVKAAEAEPPAPKAVAEHTALAVHDVRIEPTAGGRRLVVELSSAPQTLRNFVLDGPPRLVMDVRGGMLGGPVNTRFPLSDGLVERVRVGSHGDALRIVADLREAVGAHSVRQEGARIIAEIDGPAASAGRSSDSIMLAPALAADPPAAPAEPVQLAAAAEVATPPEPAAAPQAEAAPTERMRVTALPPRVPQPVETPSAYGGQRISLDLKDADVHNVLRVLADVSGLNIIATDDVKGKITLHLTDVPWDQALDLVLRANRLEKSREGNVVRISTVARLKEEREALRAAQDAERELEPLRVKYIRVNYARADEALIDKVKGVLTDRGGVTFDDRTNTVIVRDIPHGIEDASELVRELDVQSPQVLIEANLVEATEDFARALGVQWGYAYNGGPQTGTPTGSNFPGTVGVGGSGLGAGGAAPSPAAGITRAPVPFLADFPVPSGFGSGFGAGTGSALNLALGSIDGSQSLAARLTALEEAGKGKIISRPRVITMNNVAATIQSLTILRVKLPSTGTVINTGTGGAAGSASTATEKINTGITLVVTPQISSDGFVLMSIFAKSSIPDFTRTVDGIPNEVSREANSNVLVQDGQTVVLGGIFRRVEDDREAGIPYLRRVPGLGWLFKRVLRNHRREEMLVFLTPKIISAGATGLPVAERLWQERHQGG